MRQRLLGARLQHCKASAETRCTSASRRQASFSCSYLPVALSACCSGSLASRTTPGRDLSLELPVPHCCYARTYHPGLPPTSSFRHQKGVQASVSNIALFSSTIMMCLVVLPKFTIRSNRRPLRRTAAPSLHQCCLSLGAGKARPVTQEESSYPRACGATGEAGRAQQPPVPAPAGGRAVWGRACGRGRLGSESAGRRAAADGAPVEPAAGSVIP